MPDPIKMDETLTVGFVRLCFGQVLVHESILLLQFRI